MAAKATRPAVSKRGAAQAESEAALMAATPIAGYGHDDHSGYAPGTSASISAYVSLYQATPEDRIKLIRKGVKADALVNTSKLMGISREHLFATLNFPAGTVKRKIAQDQLLSPDQSERIIGLQKLIGQVETMVTESGNPQGFDPAKWIASWLDTPCPALGGDKPADYMDTIEGQRIVANQLAMMQSGAYA
jgi:putative toxin-antitoxin system antitoxin component (TIGR02293 family)